MSMSRFTRSSISRKAVISAALAAGVLAAGAPSAFAEVEVSSSSSGALIVEGQENVGHVIDVQLGVQAGAFQEPRLRWLVSNQDPASYDPGANCQFLASTIIACDGGSPATGARTAQIDLGGSLDNVDLSGTPIKFESNVTLGGADDLFTGQNGVDNVDGGSANDRLNGAGGADRLRGEGSGPDEDPRHNDRINGGPGADRIEGGIGDDIVSGGDGDQDTDSASGDRITGGPGVDRLSYARRTRGVNVRQDGVANDGQSGEGDNVRQVEDLTGTPFTDTLRAPFDTTQFPARIRGNGGRDTVVGGIGGDELRGRTVVGDPVKGNQGGDDDIFATRTAHGNGGDDNIRGGDGFQQLFGDAGRDELNAFDGFDTVSGGSGSDEIRAASDDTRDLISCDRLATSDTGAPGTADVVRFDSADQFRDRAACETVNLD
jgi:Ca2+-binding RTX toxin-like protein